MFIPSVAVKKAQPPYFGSKPFRLKTPDLGGIYDYIDAHVGTHRALLPRGAIEGVLPQGPHNIRDVLATHILKQASSYEQTSLPYRTRLTWSQSTTVASCSRTKRPSPPNLSQQAFTLRALMAPRAGLLLNPPERA